MGAGLGPPSLREKAMPALDSLRREHLCLSRRQFLSRFGMGVGTVGLATLLGPAPAARGEAPLSPMAPHRPHFPARAKRILHIFAQGAPSHIDTWDPKPALARYDGRTIPEVDG